MPMETIKKPSSPFMGVPPGGTALCKLYRHVPPHWVGFLRSFGLKTGIHFAHSSLESGGVFEGTTGVYGRYLSFQFQVSIKERKRNMRTRNGFQEFVCLRSNLSNNNIIGNVGSGPLFLGPFSKPWTNV